MEGVTGDKGGDREERFITVAYIDVALLGEVTLSSPGSDDLRDRRDGVCAMETSEYVSIATRTRREASRNLAAGSRT